MMTKLLLYCTKGKKQLVKWEKYMYGENEKNDKFNSLNGKIIAECDFEVEEIKRKNTIGDWFCYENQYEIMKQACIIDPYKFFNYLGGKNGYAIHIKNLRIFDKPRKLSDYGVKDEKINDIQYFKVLEKAPQNMCYVIDENGEKKALISIHPEWLCKILNGEKTIEIRKKVLKKML